MVRGGCGEIRRWTTRGTGEVHPESAVGRRADVRGALRSVRDGPQRQQGHVGVDRRARRNAPRSWKKKIMYHGRGSRPTTHEHRCRHRRGIGGDTPNWALDPARGIGGAEGEGGRRPPIRASDPRHEARRGAAWRKVLRAQSRVLCSPARSPELPAHPQLAETVLFEP